VDVMNMGRFSELLERLKTTKLTKLKPMVVGAIGFAILLLIIVIISNKGATKKTSYNKVKLLSSAVKPKKELDYEFIKFDTIKIPNFEPIEQRIVEPPPKIEPVRFTENTDQPKATTGRIKQSASLEPSKVETITPEAAISFQPRSVNQNPNMIVTNTLSEGTAQSGGTSSTYTGMQSALVKVVLPNRTPVANGSLVEARVLRDARWGNIFIPKRTKLIGIASLMNLRVNIDFQEIYIDDNNRSCRGRAYDLKRLQGLSYSPVSSEAKRVLLEELRDAVSGVPVLGRVANRATYSANYYTQDVSVLDEGLEFYVLIESIY
jgi:hypothetical protein